jgi:hypothetical protein
MEAADETRTPSAPVAEGRGAFGGFIGPRTLVGLVASAAPYLFDGSDPRSGEVEGAAGPRLSDGLAQRYGWWTALRAVDRLPATPAPTPAERTDYFALCLAAHFASAGTYVPTDVDAKIRHALWFEDVPDDEFERMVELALALASWDVAPVSARLVHVPGHAPVSGHDGERLSVLVGGHLASLARGHLVAAERLAGAIEAELEREAAAFDAACAPGAPVRTLVDLATTLTHNAGDVVQALGSKSARHVAGPARERWGDLARERAARFRGAYHRAAAVYREIGAPEGHRHYPLRDVKALRHDARLLLPLGPCLDAWGATIGSWPRFGPAEKAAVVCALVAGCRRVPGQQGYQRALVGLAEGLGRGLEEPGLASSYDTATRKGLADAALRKSLAVRRISFESSLEKRARALLAAAR